MTNKFSLSRLEGLVGIPRRTIRSYIEKGLVPQPLGAGRGAHYGEDHLLRLCAIRVLRDREGLSLSDIRRRLARGKRSELVAYARRLVAVETGLAAGLGKVLPELVAESEAPGTALEYVRRMMREDAGVAAVSAMFMADDSVADSDLEPDVLMPDALMISHAQVSDRQLPVARTPRRRARAEPALRIAVTPDVELIVRGTYEPDEIDRIERVAEQLAQALMEGGDDD